MFYNNLERVYTEFLPTPSARRATRRKAADVLTVRISTHALREEGDVAEPPILPAPGISTHALREEGDAVGITINNYARLISTHALREEGDRLSCLP